MSDFQEDWPEETLRNPRRDILHQQAAWLRAEADIHREQAEQAESRARSLEVLALYLDEKQGPGWPQDFESWREKRGL